MKTIQKCFGLSAAILLPLITSHSQTASAPDQGPPVPGIAPAPAPPLNPETSFFYDSLAPYGQWLWVDPYGWVWTPNSVAPGWRPYTDGSWAYSDAGWTWVSDVSWGWAPYHYGRWFFHDHRGWCWVPGSEWAPAWVAWHWGDGYCGWAPLPPLVAWQTRTDWDAVISAHSWCFVAHRDFCRPHLYEHLALVAQNVTLLRETRNVTRLEIRDRSVVNLSITAEQVAKATGQRINRLAINEIHSPSLVDRGAATLNIYRPEVKETRVVTRIENHAVVNHTSEPTFAQMRRNETARRELEGSQARAREALERQHESELRQPPHGLTALQLQERHEAEHHAFNEHVARQNQVFENTLQNQSRPAPARPGLARGGSNRR